MPRADKPAAPLTTRAKVNMLVRNYVESVDLDDAGTRRRLCEQPYHHYRFDVRQARAQHGGQVGAGVAVGRPQRLQVWPSASTANSSYMDPPSLRVLAAEAAVAGDEPTAAAGVQVLDDVIDRRIRHEEELRVAKRLAHPLCQNAVVRLAQDDVLL